MPSTSKKQHNFMAAIAHNPAFAKKVGIPQSVGKDFDEADKGKKFRKGGATRPDVQGVNKPKTNHGSMALFSKGGDTMASKMNAGFMAMMAKKKDGAGMKKMNMGGMTKMSKGGSAMPSKMGSVPTGSGKDGIASKGKTKGKMVKMNMGGRAC
jgi:hypothetical protein